MRTNVLGLIFLTFIYVLYADWSRPIARDSEPGVIYFFGSNFEPTDSTDDWYLYFSEDTGKTYSIIKEYESVDACYEDNISTDVRSGVLFLTNVSVCTYISYDFGASFEDTILDVGLIGGGIEGECGDGYHWSPDYGETIFTGTMDGYPTSSFNGNGCTGHYSGMFLVVVDMYTGDDVIMMTTDSNDTYLPITPFRFFDSHLKLGADNNEYFVHSIDSIYYSFDGCSTFTIKSELDRSVFGDIHSFTRGWQSREIISWRNTWYYDYILGYIGGCLSIHFSTDCGQTWREIVKHDMLAIEETQQETEDFEELRIINTSTNIICNKFVNMFDITGKLINAGQMLDATHLKSGVYIITDGKNNKKVCITK